MSYVLSTGIEKVMVETYRDIFYLIVVETVVERPNIKFMSETGEFLSYSRPRS